MSRTKKRVKLSNVPLEVVRRTIFKWLEEKTFTILSLNSDGSPIDWGPFWANVRPRPKAGRIVCIHYRLWGAVVFEFVIRPKGNDVLVDWESYAAGGTLWAGKEWDIDPDVLLMGRWPRKRGYRFVLELENILLLLSR
jgi:hypothetical protein